MFEQKRERTPRELHSTRRKMWDASMSNHTRYIDPATGRFAERFTEMRPCPTCDGSSNRRLFDKSGGTYNRCLDCGMVFLGPVFRDEHLIAYYRGNHTVQSEIVEDDLAFYMRLYEEGLGSLPAPVLPAGRLLDYGCSTGVFLGLAADRGWDCSGIELNAAEAAIARERGFSVQELTLNAASSNEGFDAITLWDVFEHLKDGVGFLVECRRFLRPGGIVFLQTPNSASLAARILQGSCNVFDGLEHVNLYCHESLTVACERAGYELVAFRTIIDEIGVINNYLNFDDPYLGDTDDTVSVLGAFPRETILEHDLGYKFQVSLRMRSR